MFWLFLLQHAMRQVSPLPEGADQPPWIRSGKLDEYQLLGSIGKGAFGEVFLAETPDGQRKAVKVFLPQEADRRAFDLEFDGMEFAQHAGRHPNIIPIEKVGRTEFCMYYVMPLADSCSEAQYIPCSLYNRMASGPLNEEELLQMASAILRALEFLHGKKLIHRDIKPDNILKVNGVWCLGDPGLLSPCRPKRFAGTPGFYLSGKNRRADIVDDLYALGKVLYCASTGMDPEHYPLVPPDYDYSKYPRLRRICRRAAERKYKNANEMRKDVEDVYSAKL